MYKMQVLIGTVLFFADLFVLTKSNYEHICIESNLRTPYVKIYDKRNGPLLYDYSPGIYEVSHLKNIYVCTNGPVWLFLSHYTEGQGIADVYDEPIYGIHVHECGFYNGEGGPGSSMKKPVWLKAIMLAGDKSDYSRSSMQLFTAPYQPTTVTTVVPIAPDQPSEPTGYINVTSLVLINAHRCTILKGLNKVELRIDVQLSAGEAAMKRICYLPYQDTDSWVLPENKQGAEDLLKNEDGMITGTCSNQNDKNAPTGDEIKTKMMEINQNSIDALPKFIEDFPQATDRGGEITTAESDLNALKADATKKDEVKEKTRDLDILKANQKYFEWYTIAKSILESLTTDSGTVIGDFDTIVTKTGIVDTKNVSIESTKNERVLLLENEAISEKEKEEQYNTLKSRFIKEKEELDTAITELNDEMAKIQPKVSKIEMTLKKYEEALRVLRLAKKENDATISKDGTKNLNYKLPSATSEIEQKRINDKVTLPALITVDKTKTGIEVKDQTTGEQTGGVVKPEDQGTTGEERICKELPFTGGLGYFEEKGTCNEKKASKLFGCQLLRASIGEPGICSYKPSEVDLSFSEDKEAANAQTNPDSDPAETLTAKVGDFIPQYMLDVLDLIKSIYVTACDRVKPPRFAKRVNDILLCYLVRQRQNNSISVSDLPKPSRLKFWNKIIGALQDCKSHKHKLEFRKENATSNKYYLYQKKDLSLGKYFDVPFMKEQAENEFGFNFAIDMNWKVFATVLGLCMPSYESKIPLITSRFFTLYTEEFLQPLVHIWNSTGHNNVFKRILSSYYGAGGTEKWVSTCMEASYIYSSDITYRPPRKLLVNQGFEYNYFVDKDGKYKPNKKIRSGCTAACKDKN